MRIIAGAFGGRMLQSPHNNITHPMSEKMRGALFNALGDVTGLSFFDPFAGTGACSLEAISRGAAHATLVEANTDSFKTILVNAKDLGVLDKLTVKRGNCAGWSGYNKSVLFDIAIADPPYKPKDIDIALAFRMARHVRQGGIFVLSAPPAQAETVALRAKQNPQISLLSHKTHGDGSLYFYRQNRTAVL